MVALFFIFAIICLLLFKNSKYNKYFFLLALSMIIILISGNYTNLDYDNYEATYSDQLEGHLLEWGYGGLRQLCNNVLNINYLWFRLLVTTLSSVVLAYGVSNYIPFKSPYYGEFLLLFILFPFFWDIPVHRNYLGFAFFIFSIKYLAVYNIRNLISFLVCILLAASFQAAYLFYIPLIVIYLLRQNNKKAKVIQMMIVALLLLTFIPNSILGLMQNYIQQLGDDRLRYVDSVQTRYGYILNIFQQFIIFSVAKYGYKEVNKNITEFDNNDNLLYHYIETIFYISMVGFAYCSLYRIQGNFTRLLINQVPLVYIEYACVMILLKKNKNNYKNRLFSNIIWLYALFFFLQKLYPHMEDIIMPALSDNWFIENI